MNTNKEYNELAEKMLESKKVFSGKLLHVFADEVELPNGEKTGRELIRHIGAVCIVALTDDNEIILEKQFRYPLNDVVTEIPAGKLDSKDEDHLEAAKREFQEETGYTAREWTELGVFHPAVAYADEAITMYLARGLKAGTQNLDSDEFLHVYKAPLDEVVADILSGKITDGKTQSAVLKAAMVVK